MGSCTFSTERVSDKGYAGEEAFLRGRRLGATSRFVQRVSCARRAGMLYHAWFRSSLETDDASHKSKHARRGVVIMMMRLLVPG